MRFFRIAAASLLTGHVAHGLPGLIQKRCSHTDWVATPDAWNALGVDNWITSWWNNVTDKSVGFVNALVSQYMLPDSNVFQCSVHRECQPNCDDVVNTAGVNTNSQSAWFVLNGITNLNYWLTYVYEGINQAQLDANSFTAGIVAAFSSAESTRPDNTILDELINLFGTILSVAIAPFFGGIAAQIPAGIANAIIYTVTTGQDLTLEKLAVFGDFVGSAAGHARDAVDTSDNALMKGDGDSQGSHIWDYLKGGQFTLRTDPNEPARLSAWLKVLLIGGGINALWKSDRTYIVASDSSDCTSDNRGPSNLRYCAQDLGGQPDGRVYYAYMMPDFGEPYPQPWEPIGSDDSHMNARNLSLKIAMKSSVDAYNVAKFDYTKVRQDRWATAMMQNHPDSPQAQWAAFEGVFTIPVCYDPSGGSITTVHSDSGRRYPCLCGGETADFATAAGFFKDDFSASKYCNFCNDNHQVLVDGPNGKCSKYIYDPAPAPVR